MPDATTEGAFFAWNFFYAAKRAHNRLKGGPQPEEVIPAALASILCSVSALEAFINELDLYLSYSLKTKPLADDNALTTLSARLQRIEGDRGKIQEKYLEAADALGKPFNKGQRPYQDFGLLVGLRNALVHYKGAIATYTVDGNNTFEYVYEEKDKGIFDKLRSKKVLRGAGSALLLEEIGTVHVARWACNTVTDMVQYLVAAIPDGEHRDLLVSVTGLFQHIP